MAPTRPKTSPHITVSGSDRAACRCAIQTCPCASPTRIFNSAIPGTDSLRQASCKASPAVTAHSVCAASPPDIGQAAVTASPENCKICPPVARIASVTCPKTAVTIDRNSSAPRVSDRVSVAPPIEKPDRSAQSTMAWTASAKSPARLSGFPRMTPAATGEIRDCRPTALFWSAGAKH